MGKNSKARRDAKAKRRASHQHRGQRSTRFDGAQYFVEDDGAQYFVEDEVHALWEQVRSAPSPASPQLVAAVDGLVARPAAVVDAALTDLVHSFLDSLWRNGWQPVELIRQARRVSALTARFVEFAILADHLRRRSQRIDPRWATQLLQLGQRDIPAGDGWVARWREREHLDRTTWCTAVAGAVNTLAWLPVVDCLIPPPGAPAGFTVAGPAERSGTGHPALERIRKLLAKAEATNFEEEAAAFTAKAQELMTRHAIDEALLHEATNTSGPVTIRVPVDAPYADAKAMLLSVVAEANRSRAVFLTRLGMCSVIGHAEDLAAVEMLFTSLLVQAQNALAHAGRAGAGSRARSASYRSSFFVAYAHRIGERLMTANEETVAEVGGRALPALRNRERMVDDYMDERYGDTLVASGVRGGYDPLGRAHGREAADDAALVAGQIA